jgi:hypothetical protein
MFLEMQRIQLDGDFWGHRKDLNEYYITASSVFEKIEAMKIEGKFTENIKTKISRKRKLNPEMVAYILAKENSA